MVTIFRFFRRRRALAERIEELIGTDLDEAASLFASHRDHLDEDNTSRIGARIRLRFEARDNNHYLSRALAEGAISPSAAFELLEAYEAAGYVTNEQHTMHRRHILDAYHREFIELLADPGASRFDYFRRVDAYRDAGYLTHDELVDFESLAEAKINPDLAARRLFDRARTTQDDSQQEQLLRRYLMEFVGFPDFPRVASLFLSLKIDALWATIPGLRSARKATIAVHELNGLLESYLPFTSDLSLSVPFQSIISDFEEIARDFKPETDAVRPITPKHINRVVIVVEKRPGESGSYEEERNSFFSVGAKARVRAVRPDSVFVEHGGDGLPYSRVWKFLEYHGSQFAQIRPNSSFAVWKQEEVGVPRSRRPSPIFIHQYRKAVKTMATLLEAHRADNPPPSSVPVSGVPLIPGPGDTIK